MTAAIFGLVGVLLGSILSMLKDGWLKHQDNAKNARFLSIQVVGQLDRFVFSCSEVVTDDGIDPEPTDDLGYRSVQVKQPKFEPEKLDVEWRSIPVDLLYEILDLPYKTELANCIVTCAAEYANQSDCDDFFEERQLQYASLGLIAASLASRLRVVAKLPQRRIAHWNPVELMQGKQSEIDATRTTRARRVETLSANSLS